MKNQIYKVLLIALWATFPGLLFAGETDKELFNAIQSRNDLWVRFYNSDDAASIAKMHTENATVIAPNYGPAKGHDEIQAGLEEELALGEGKMELKTLEVTRASDDTAYEIGLYTLRIEIADSDPIVDEGHYVIIWKLEEKEWRIHVDMWNTSLPLE
jgi:ketosteroid isomerase-like protein